MEKADRLISDEENIWLRDTVGKMWETKPEGMKSGKFVRKFNIGELYQKKFKKEKTGAAIAGWIDRVLDRENYLNRLHDYQERKKSGEFVSKAQSKNPAKILAKSNFILIIGDNVAGYETEEEVKEVIINSQILGGAKLFKNVPIDIKYEVKIG